MHEFMNAFVGAFVTNRTLLWQYCPRKSCSVDDEETCSRFVTRSSWIPSVHYVQQLYNEKCRNYSKFDTEFTLMASYMRHYSDRKVSCCGIDGLNQTVITYAGYFDRREMFHLSYHPSTFLHESSRVRSQLLFQQGDHASYGLLFRRAFTFTNTIIEENDKVIHEAVANASRYLPSMSTKFYYISLHMRHSNNGDNGNTYDSLREHVCLDQVIKQVPSGSQCVVLIATDRQLALDRLRLHVETLGCISVISNHTKVNRVWGEHGPFWGDIAMQDIELLSRGHFFIGSSYTGGGTASTNLRSMLSSYSMLIASLFSTNEINKERESHQVIRWLPTCGDSYVDKLYNDEVVQGNNYTCDKHVLLPYECPHKTLFNDPEK